MAFLPWWDFVGLGVLMHPLGIPQVDYQYQIAWKGSIHFYF
jgi:hypothetical protein